MWGKVQQYPIVLILLWVWPKAPNDQAAISFIKFPAVSIWASASDIETEAESSYADTDDGLTYIQKNPDYSRRSSSKFTPKARMRDLKKKLSKRAHSDSDDDNSSGSEEEDEEIESSSVQETLHGLTQQITTSKKFKKIQAVYKKHKTLVWFTLFLLLFHHQLVRLLSSGAAQSITPSPATILRIIFLINALRRLGFFHDQSLSNIAFGNFVKEKMKDILPTRLEAFNPPLEQHFMFERVNDRYLKDSVAISKSMNPGRVDATTASRSNGINNTSVNATQGIFNQTEDMEVVTDDSVVVILEIKPDINFSFLSTFRDALDFLKRQKKDNPHFAEKHMNVVLVLESAGGSAQSYGIAAYDLSLLSHTPNVTLTVCIDKVAASGGYMLASQATPGHLLAAPFSLVGSIGVMGQTINVQKVLEGFGVTPLVFKAGTHKAPVGLIGDVTEEGVAIVQEMVNSQHAAFKRMIQEARGPIIGEVDNVATGEVWLAQDAVDIGLVDAIMSSTEFIGSKLDKGFTVLRLLPYRREPFQFFRPGGARPPQPFSTSAPSFLPVRYIKQFFLFMSAATSLLQSQSTKRGELKVDPWQ